MIENYTKQNLENLKTFCKNNKIKLHIISFKKEFGYSLSYIRSMLYSKRINLKSCTICGVLRRYLLNKHAKKLKAGIIATGHNLDDEAQSILMNLFKNNIELLAKLGPKTGIIKTKNFIPRIKPLYFISEKEITAFSKKNKFPVDYSPCPCREGAYRNHIRKLINKYEKTNPNIKKNIINSFLKIIPNLKQHYKTSAEPQTCIKCKEPSRNKICMTCQILEKLK